MVLYHAPMEDLLPNAPREVRTLFAAAAIALPLMVVVLFYAGLVYVG